MEKATKTYYPTQMVTSINENLKVLLNINRVKYKLPLESLFYMAARQNIKREFLFVSRVLGKHLPIPPQAIGVIGKLLALAWSEELGEVHEQSAALLVDALLQLQAEGIIKNSTNELLNSLPEKIRLKERTLFIGFAETATGIAQSVFNNFENATYIHTTREEISGLEPCFIFKEEHSHAVDHSIYAIDKKFLEGFERIVLIDDELTTGNTALNLMKNLPGKSFGLITILDWRNEDHINKFNIIKDLDIKVASLVKGTISCEKNGATSASDQPVNIKTRAEVKYSELILKGEAAFDGYLSYTGRFGITDKDNVRIHEEIKRIGSLLKEKRRAGNCLCLGTEEFIYVPCMISSYLGDNVFFHSTTRSPIHSRNQHNYCIKNKVTFPNPNHGQTANYLYNIPSNFYNQVFLFSEKPLPKDSKELFRDMFSTFNIPEIIFVTWN